MTNDRPFVNVSGRLSITSGFFEVPGTIQAKIDGSGPGGIIVVGQHGNLNVYGGSASQTIRHVLVESEGYLFVSGSLANAYDAYVNSGGSMHVVDGAGAFEIETEGSLHLDSASDEVGHIYVNSGGYMEVVGTFVTQATVRYCGAAFIGKGAHVERIHVCSGAECTVRNGSVASAEIESGATMSLINGTATEVFLHSGGVMTKAGRCKIHYQSISEVGGAVFKDYGNEDEIDD